MSDLVRTRQSVIDLLHRFDEPAVRRMWLECQANLWEWEPSVVLSILTADTRLPAGPFGLSPSTSGTVEVLDSTLLRSSSVHLVATSHAPPPLSWLQSVDALRELLEDLDVDAPALPPLESTPDEWGRATTWTLIGHVIEKITGDAGTAGIGRAVVWTAIGNRVDLDALHTRSIAGEQAAGWDRTLEVLTDACSAAATILTVLAVDGGGRDIPSTTIEREGTSWNRHPYLTSTTTSKR
jgi:hypothetical protein